MSYFNLSKIPMLLAGLLGAYILGYAIARSAVFHAVETYPEGKGRPRQDFITKKDHQPGQGWSYQLFLPGIKIEEFLKYYLDNRDRSSYGSNWLLEDGRDNTELNFTRTLSQLHPKSKDLTSIFNLERYDAATSS